MSHYIIVDTLSHSSSFVNNINLHQAYSLVNFNLVNVCVTNFSIIFPKIYNSLHAVNSEKQKLMRKFNRSQKSLLLDYNRLPDM